MNFTSLPDSLLVFIFFDWLELKSLAIFDSAICNETERKDYLKAIISEKHSVIEKFVNVVEKNVTCLIFHKWCLDRGVTMKRVNFEAARDNGNLKVRKWLSSGIYELNTITMITSLRFEKLDLHRPFHIDGRRYHSRSFDQFPELQQNVLHLINHCKKTLRSLDFQNCGICDKTLISLINESGMALTELIIVDMLAHDKSEAELLVKHLVKFNCLTTLKLNFSGSNYLGRIGQQSIVSLLEVNRNLTHLDLHKVMVVDDSFLSSVSTHCKSLKQFLCKSMSGPSGGFPSASAIADYLGAPHESLELMRLHSECYYDTANGYLNDNPSEGIFSFEFNKHGTITASVACSKQTVKSIFVNLTKVTEVKVMGEGSGRVYTGAELAHAFKFDYF
jgi:hypothetical protein